MKLLYFSGCQKNIVKSNERPKQKHLQHQEEEAVGREKFFYYSCVNQIQWSKCPVKI